jgi:NPCBM/NEW2 domain
VTEQKTIDPAIEAARIARRGAVTAALVAALITGAATGVSAYFAGRKQGADATSASTVTVVRTETVTQSGGPSSSGPAQQAGGAKSLLELNPVEAQGAIQTGPRRVDTKDYQRTITAVLGTCLTDSASRTYHLDRKYRRLQTKIGLDDGSKSSRWVEFRVFVDEEKIDSATTKVTVGQVRTLDIDVANALRVRLETDFLGDCYNEQQVSAVWIEPSLT